jgi:predicted transcriptional regulator
MYATQLGEIEIGVKAQKLSHCGFSNAEIAELLGMTTNAVNVALHRARKGKKVKQ